MKLPSDAWDVLAPDFMKAAICTTLFAIALAVSFSIIGAWIPDPDVPGVSEKLRYLRESGDAYNVLFIGSSRVHHQIIPELFDRLMGEGGIPVRSFNLGVDGARPPEDAYLLEHALQGRRTPITMVIEEGNAIRFRGNEQMSDTLRGSYWRDRLRMLYICRRLLTGKEPGQKNVWQRFGEFAHESEDFWVHCLLWLPKATHVGEGVPILDRLCNHFSPTRLEAKLGSRLDGFVSEGNEPMPSNILRGYEKDMARREREPIVADYADPTSQQLVQWSERTVAEHGGKLILVLPPTVNDSKFYPSPAFGPTPPVLDFCDVAQFPQLYAVENRKDSGHLNQRGAELFTRLIVQQLLASGAACLRR